MIGETVGNFRIVSRLGRGGMGEVFLAEQQKIGTRVAIKMLLPELSADKMHVDRFFNEALAVNKIKHAGIVKIFDVGFHEGSGCAYLIMEFLEGESLAGRIARGGRLPLGEICEIGRQIASILEATHSEGITHRDLKPDNVFLVRDAELASRERVKILDFGIAKLTGTLAGGPKTSGTMGTPGYMAPEQWGDSANVDWRADVYSLGCLAFEMATGRVPFVAATFPEAFVKHTTEPAPPVRTLAGDLPQELEWLIAQMLAKQPQERPASMSEIVARFEQIGRGQPGLLARTMLPDGSVPNPTNPTGNPYVTAPPTPTTLGRSAAQAFVVPAKKSRAPIWIGLGVLVAGGGGAAAFFAMRGPDEEQPIAKPNLPASVDAGVADGSVIDGGQEITLKQRIEKSNPFVDVRGVKLQVHQVSNLEYRWYLETLGDDAVRAQPVDPKWDPKAPATDQPIGWVTFERARRFCEAIDASLPSDEQWLRASDGRWGLDPEDRGVRGPLEEWTATVRDGFAIVRGGYATMSNDDKQLAIESPMSKSTEALAGAGAPAKIIASAVIGFRCAR